MPTKTHLLIAVVALVILTAASLAYIVRVPSKPDGQSLPAHTLPATSFERLPTEIAYKNLDGALVRLADTSDKKIRIINTWATWCLFCIEELPHFIELQKTATDTVTVIAINRGESVEKQREYFAKAHINENDIVFLADTADTFYTNVLGGFSMPETIFVDEDNRILLHRRGPMTSEEMRERVESILETSRRVDS